MMTSSPLPIRVVSYNVLSNFLARPDHFRNYDTQVLDSSIRFTTLCEKLSVEMQSSPIICLQEVSTPWAGRLHIFFSNQNYHVITGLYGSDFSGNMGVLVAIPLKEYDIVDVEITKISNDMPRFNINDDLWMLDLLIMTPFNQLFQLVGLATPPVNPWKEASSRKNQMISVRVKAKQSGSVFVIGNYHMPCMYKLPQSMMICSALAAQHLQKFAHQDPYIFAGDFNFTPSSSMYEMFVAGKVDDKNTDLPPHLDQAKWTCAVRPLRSAYKEALGREPVYTNCSQVASEPVFINTLDYIFLSPEWVVEEVLELTGSGEEAIAHGASGAEVRGALMPNLQEPSDHLLISATLSLPVPTSDATGVVLALI